MKYSIIVPMYGYIKGVEQLMWDIHDTFISHENEYEVIIMDDCSPISESFILEKVLWWRKNVFSKETLHYHRNKLNYGFGMNCNLGFERSSGKYIFFISTDVKIKGDFLSSSDMILGCEDGTKKVLGGRLLSGDTGWNKFDNSIFPYLEGWMLGFKASDFIELGGFDPVYGKFDYEDVDLSTKALASGYVLEPLPIHFFEHYSGRSISPLFPDRETITKKNQELFRRKWNV